MEHAILAIAMACVVALLAQVTLVVWDTRRRRRAHEALRLKAIRVYLAVREIRHLSERLRDGSDDGVDFDAPAPITQMPHDHIWGARPASEDSTSRTYRCQYPRCRRLHTIMR